MAVTIVTDSTCDLTLEAMARLGIKSCPLKVRFGDQEYRDGIDISISEFYSKMRASSQLPVTSQVNPTEFENFFREELKTGNDILCVTLGKELSGTYQSACIAKEMLEADNIQVVDSGSVSIGLASIVTRLAELRDQGMNLRELTEAAGDLVKRINIVAVIDNLTYLQKGGRLSAGAAIVGGLLGIKPVVQAKDTVTVLHKTRGFKAAYQWMIDEALRQGVDTSLPLHIAHGDNESAARDFYTMAKEKLPVSEELSLIGVVIGTHAGPGTVGLSFFRKEA